MNAGGAVPHGIVPDGIAAHIMVADRVLATHPIISAVPFFVPTFVVVAVIAVVIWRDRRRGDDAPGETGRDSPGDGPGDGPGKAAGGSGDGGPDGRPPGP
ncbi:Uncharacterised protein [Mycobacterium tuberculosis]|nr:Uncharacterised protein [Mycobacterium tuberculosis]